MPVKDRRIALKGAANCRDLGGYATADGRHTRWRTIYRSDSLSDLTDADLSTFHSLGIRTLCDFRLPEESARKPNRLPKEREISVIRISFIPDGALDMLSRIDAGEYLAADIEREVLIQYRKFATDHADEFRRLFQIILSPGSLPLLMHCTSGKDRTGFAAAAVLLAAGVPRAGVVEDYAMTNQYRRDIAFLFSTQISHNEIETLTAANPRYIEAALDEIDARFGSTSQWLESLGLGADARARLQELVTEP